VHHAGAGVTVGRAELGEGADGQLAAEHLLVELERRPRGVLEADVGVERRRHGVLLSVGVLAA
jgi:hypothetical protein